MYPSKAHIREIQWGSTHLWDVHFQDPTPPAPFDSWFPAVSVSENVYTMENQTFQFYLSSFSIPKNTAEFSLDITYQDDVKLTMLNWFSDWVNEGILNGEDEVTPLSACNRKVAVRKLNYLHEVVSESIYYVVPDGSGNYEGESDGNGQQYQLNMKIVGKLDTGQTTENGDG